MRMHPLLKLAAAVATLGMLTGGGSSCTDTPPPTKQPVPNAPPAKRRQAPITIHVEGTGRNVWILVVADGKTVDTHTDYRLPYHSEFLASFGLKVEAKNGPNDHGSIECTLEDRNSGMLTHQTGHGPNAMVTCLVDATRA